MQITGMRLTGLFFTCEWIWFGILESYAIKRFMRLTGMPLAEDVCIGLQKINSHLNPLNLRSNWHAKRRLLIFQSSAILFDTVF